MFKCINCNRPEVTRRGNTFTCAKCGYVWDVAHEQANAAYLAVQGREPAKAVEEAPADPADNQSPAVKSPLDALQDLATPVKFDTLSNLEEPLGTPLPELDPAVEHKTGPEETPETWTTYENLTVDELKALAVERGIDLAGCTRKAEIIAALREAEA